MRLPDAPNAYGERDQRELRRLLEIELNNKVHRRGAHVVLGPDEHIEMYDTDGSGARYTVTVASGVLTVTLIT